MEHIILIYPHRPRLQFRADADRRIQILRVHRGREPVCRRVAHPHCVVLGLELGNRAHGAKDLVLHDLHVLAHVAEHGRLDEVPRVAGAGATNLDFGAFFLARVDVSISVC